MGSINVGSNTTTQRTGYPDWVESAQKTYFDQLGKYFQGGLENGGAPLAEMNPALKQGVYLQERMLDGPVENYADEIMGAGGGVTGDDITSLMSPFLQSVGRETIDAMSRERANEDTRIGARNASAVAFGGSGPALERAQNNRAYGENLGKAVSGIMQSGWESAADIARANADRELAAASQAGQAQSDADARQRDVINDRLKGGAMWQDHLQRNEERPWDLLQQYGSLLPSAPQTRRDTEPETWSPLDTLFSVGKMFL